jgi:hypothetical protein
MNAIIIAVVVSVVGIGSYFITKKPDGPIEEISEVVIEKQLGLPDGSVDLTPETDEE